MLFSSFISLYHNCLDSPLDLQRIYEQFITSLLVCLAPMDDSLNLGLFKTFKSTMSWRVLPHSEFFWNIFKLVLTDIDVYAHILFISTGWLPVHSGSQMFYGGGHCLFQIPPSSVFQVIAGLSPFSDASTATASGDVTHNPFYIWLLCMGYQILKYLTGWVPWGRAALVDDKILESRTSPF